MRRLSAQSVVGLLAFAVPFAIYAASLAPGVGYWDTGEAQTVPYLFGIMHETGFPAFVLAGWLVSHVLPFGSVAWRLSLMSAAAMAGAAYLVYALVVLLDGKRGVALGAALLFAAGDVVWTRGSRAEVHALAALFGASTLYLTVLWHETRNDRALYGAALSYGLALATHGVAVLLAPGLALLLLPGILGLRPATIVRAALLLVAPGLLYLYIPLRSAYLYAHALDPTLALGLPPGRPFWDYGHTAASPSTFWQYLRGGQTSVVGSTFAGLFAFTSYPAVLDRFSALALGEFGGIGAALGVLGILLLARRRLWLVVCLVVTIAVTASFALTYPEADSDRYLLIPYWLLAAFAGIGLSRGLGAYFERSNWVPARLSELVLLALAVVLFVRNAAVFNQRNDVSSAYFIDRVIAETPADAILIANWGYATTLGYAAYVERRLGNRIVVTAWPGDYRAYYSGWLKRRPIYLINQPEFPDSSLKSSVISQDPHVVQLQE